jgi:hypothetical protein
VKRPRLVIPIHRLNFAPSLGFRGKQHTKGLYGYCDKRERVIGVDPRSAYPARVLLHELLHLRNPSWSESKVYKETNRLWAQLTWKEKGRLYQALGKGRVAA